jgi:glycosyltransferase involved in cell wall biosynthesis
MNLAHDLGIAQRVRWLRYVDRERLVGLYASADAYVSFSVREGFGLPTLEALACGTPVLISNVGAAQEFQSDEAAIITPASEPEELASALEAIVARAHQTGVRQAARAVAELFPWERTATELLRVAAGVTTRSA